MVLNTNIHNMLLNWRLYIFPSDWAVIMINCFIFILQWFQICIKVKIITKACVPVSYPVRSLEQNDPSQCCTFQARLYHAFLTTHNSVCWIRMTQKWNFHLHFSLVNFKNAKLSCLLVVLPSGWQIQSWQFCANFLRWSFTYIVVNMHVVGTLLWNCFKCMKSLPVLVLASFTKILLIRLLLNEESIFSGVGIQTWSLLLVKEALCTTQLHPSPWLFCHLYVYHCSTTDLNLVYNLLHIRWWPTNWDPHESVSISWVPGTQNCFITVNKVFFFQYSEIHIFQN